MMRMKAREGRREKEAKDEKGTNTFGNLVHSVGEKKKKEEKERRFHHVNHTAASLLLEYHRRYRSTESARSIPRLDVFAFLVPHVFFFLEQLSRHFNHLYLNFFPEVFEIRILG